MSTTTRETYKQFVTWLAERGMSYAQWTDLSGRDADSYVRAWLSSEDADGRTVEESMRMSRISLEVASPEPAPFRRVEDAEKDRFELFSDAYSVLIFIAAIIYGGYLATTAPAGFWMDFLRGLFP